MLKRWHGSLKGMPRKLQKDKKDWDLYLKYLLFAYRQTPHSTTGFSPFKLIYGRNMRGPLEVLKGEWMKGNLQEASVLEWINQLSERMADNTAGNEKDAKCKMKVRYDKTAKERRFNLGEISSNTRALGQTTRQVGRTL